jgi:hypothetical protein
MDIVFILPLMASIPMLIKLYLKPAFFSQSQRNLALYGGLIWMMYVFISEYVSEHFLGVPWMDAHYHAHYGKAIAEEITKGNWQYFFDHFTTGNHAYHCYSSLILSTGATIFTLTGVNAFLAFWGGLVLASCFSSICPYPKERNLLFLFTIFSPSVIFWCTVNLKEAMMYWAVCLIFSLGFPHRSIGYFARVPLSIIAVLIGALLRPHVLIGWLAAVAGIMIFRSGKRTAGIIMLMCMPIVAFSLRTILKSDFSQEVALQMGESQFSALTTISHQGSAIKYESGRPIFLLSGIAAAYLRPFPWEIRSSRTFASSVETWAMTFLIIFSWWSLNGRDRWYALKLPGIQIALLASLWMCMLLSYFPNEGLVVRQRVQLIPALLACAIIPLLMKQYATTRLKALERQSSMRDMQLKKAMHGN